jgi:hypothetical protein
VSTPEPGVFAEEGQVVSTPERGVFAEDWVTAWYRHDVDAVLTHFHDDVVFTSPVAARVMPHSKGVVRGKADLREYWCAALNTMPDLHFEIVGIYRGESVLVINYRNQSGALVNELLEFDGGLVRRGHGTYQLRS